MTDELRNRPNTAGLGEPVWDSRNSDEPTTPTTDAADRAAERIGDMLFRGPSQSDIEYKSAISTIIREEHAKDVAELVEALRSTFSALARASLILPPHDGNKDRASWDTDAALAKARVVLAKHTP